MSNNSKPTPVSPLGSTDLSRWHLLPAPGEDQAVWTYDSSPDKSLGEQSFPTKYWLSRHSVSSSFFIHPVNLFFFYISFLLSSFFTLEIARPPRSRRKPAPGSQKWIRVLQETTDA
jgi:hypothetical protein